MPPEQRKEIAKARAVKRQQYLDDFTGLADSMDNTITELAEKHGKKPAAVRLQLGAVGSEGKQKRKSNPFSGWSKAKAAELNKSTCIVSMPSSLPNTTLMNEHGAIRPRSRPKALEFGQRPDAVLQSSPRDQTSTIPRPTTQVPPSHPSIVMAPFSNPFDNGNVLGLRYLDIIEFQDTRGARTVETSGTVVAVWAGGPVVFSHSPPVMSVDPIVAVPIENVLRIVIPGNIRGKPLAEWGRERSLSS